MRTGRYLLACHAGSAARGRGRVGLCAGLRRTMAGARLLNLEVVLADQAFDRLAARMIF
jgi:hypothetical protein